LYIKVRKVPVDREYDPGVRETPSWFHAPAFTVVDGLSSNRARQLNLTRSDKGVFVRTPFGHSSHCRAPCRQDRSNTLRDNPRRSETSVKPVYWRHEPGSIT
jgi:hypothetical protein